MPDLKLNFIAIHRIESNNKYTYTYVRYKFTKRKITNEICDINIIVKSKNKNEKGKTLTLEEKIELFKRYWEEKHELPPEKEIYNGFNIGRFYAMCLKNENVMTMVHDIISNGDVKAIGKDVIVTRVEKEVDIL